jgi:hypothetical protein
VKRRTQLRAKKPLRAKAQPKRARKPIKPKKRKPSEFARIYGSRERVQAIKALRCEACWKYRGPSENAHIKTGGTGRKADFAFIVPLCRGHHRTDTDSLHNLGSVEAFDAKHGTNLKARAAFLAEFLRP